MYSYIYRFSVSPELKLFSVEVCNDPNEGFYEEDI